MEIKIPFNGWSKDKIRLQKKTATTRNQKYGETGDIFWVEKKMFKLDLVIKLPLWFVITELYPSEGAESMMELKKVWEDIHPRKGYVPEQIVWYHHWSGE